MITREIFDEALSELRKQDAIVKDVANRVKLAFRAEPGVADDVDEDLMEWKICTYKFLNVVGSIFLFVTYILLIRCSE